MYVRTLGEVKEEDSASKDAGRTMTIVTMALVGAFVLFAVIKPLIKPSKAPEDFGF